jgi:D-alanyl-D-alanine dipeptidase
MAAFGLASCAPEKKAEPLLPPVAKAVAKMMIHDYDTTKWTELRPEDGYIIDIRYATADNFVKEVIYPCGRMFLRPEAAVALAKVNDALRPLDYKIKLFDGYRPRPAQQKLWDKVPNPTYVAPPSEGSMHSRGVAIDLTLADLEGKEVDMGTSYDFFGRQAHHDYLTFPREILDRRRLLRETMEMQGFQSIRTEWWHYSYNRHRYPLDDWQWACEH